MNKKNTKKTSKSIKSKKETTLDLELQESQDKYLRLYSEFENYRRRTSKEKVEMINSANKELISLILPVIDDLTGLSQSKLKFVKKFVDITKLIENGVKKFKSEVLKKQFPKAKHSFSK